MRNLFAQQRADARNNALAANQANLLHNAYASALAAPMHFVVHKAQLPTLQNSKALKSKTGNLHVLGVFATTSAAQQYIADNCKPAQFYAIHTV